MTWDSTALGASVRALAGASALLPVRTGRPPRHDGEGEWTTVAEYVEGPALDATIERIADLYGTPPRVAVAYFSRWWASRAAHAVAFPLVRDRRAFVPHPDELWLRHAGWIDGLALERPRALVLADDPGAGTDGATTVATDAELRRRAMQALVDLAAPMVDALCRRARISERQHWASIADGIAEACVLAGESTGERERAWAACEELLALATPPLHIRPRRFVLDHDGEVEVAVVKVQCDLAYLDGRSPKHFCLPCPIVKDAERRARMIEQRLHPH
jgi:hypothetical protein